MSNPADPDPYDYIIKAFLDAFNPHVIEVNQRWITLDEEGFGMLYEYSTSLPTGQTDGKVWKLQVRRDGTWHMGEYVDTGDPNYMGIRYRRIKVVKNARAS